MPHPCGSPRPSLPDPAPRLLPRLDRRLWEGWEGQDRPRGKLPPPPPLASQATASRSPLFLTSCSSAMMSAGAPVKRFGNQVSEPGKTHSSAQQVLSTR